MVPNNRPPTGTVTFFFTDVEGFTALCDNYPDRTQAALERHDDILRSAIGSHDGYVFGTGGDAFSASFSTAREALRAALASQRALLAEQWPENATLRVRMGLHTGVAEERVGNYFGTPVNRAARLMSTGHGGQVLLSDATYNLVRDVLVHLEPEAEMRYLGEHRLKDLKNTERIFQLVVPDLPKDFPPLKTRGLVTPAQIIDLDHRFRRLRYLGGGGFGKVYLVHHEALDRNMALKVLKDEYVEDEQFVERFKREAKSAAKLNHPNIVTVYDAGEGLFEGQKVSYIAMEHVLGGTLKDLMQQQKGALPARSAVELTLQVAKALEAAHRQGIVHRDIKPENVLITESGEAKVADFGLARAVAASTRLTRAGFLMGTLHYISPEQAQGDPASFQSDLYSLGVVLYQMLTAELPFDADTPAGIMMKHISRQPLSPKELNPKIPKKLNEVCLKLLAKDPNDRYPSASVLMDELEELRRSLEDEERFAEQPTFMEDQTIPIDREDEKKVEEEHYAETIPGEPEAPSTVEVPDLRGRTASQAGDMLANRGLKLGDQEEVTSEEVAEGEIVEQNPGSGTRVEVGSPVSVTVSSGPSLVEIPNLTGQKLPQARRALNRAGLWLGGQKKASNNEVSEGNIVKQEPAAGTKAKRDSSVSITISSGHEQTRARERQRDEQARHRQRAEKATTTVPDVEPERRARWRWKAALRTASAFFAGAAWVALGLIDSITLRTFSLSELFMFSHWPLLVACLCTLGGIVGIHTRQASVYGRLGLIGFLTVSVVTVLMCVSLVEALFFEPQLLRQGLLPELLGWAFLALSLCAIIGLALLGVATLRARVLPRWSGWLLVIGPPVALVIIFAAVLLQQSILVKSRPNHYVFLAFLPFGAIWLALAYALWSKRGEEAHRPTRAG